jgi:hypothetical protein
MVAPASVWQAKTVAQDIDALLSLLDPFVGDCSHGIDACQSLCG